MERKMLNTKGPAGAKMNISKRLQTASVSVPGPQTLALRSISLSQSGNLDISWRKFGNLQRREEAKRDSEILKTSPAGDPNSKI